MSFFISFGSPNFVRKAYCQRATQVSPLYLLALPLLHQVCLQELVDVSVQTSSTLLVSCSVRTSFTSL
jgi:hypothetical protein